MRRATLLFSLVSGGTAMLLGLGATLVLLSLLIGHPIGPTLLFDRISAVVPAPNSFGGVTGTLRIDKLIPSMTLVGIFVVGVTFGGLAVGLAQGRRHARIAQFAKLGLLSNVLGILVWWVSIMLIDWTQYD